MKEDGVWKFQALRFFPTFITDYDKAGPRTRSRCRPRALQLPPDRPPTSIYEIYPKAHIPPYHYDNPVTGAEPHYPTSRGGPSEAAIAAIRAHVSAAQRRAARRPQANDVEALVAEAERRSARVKDFHEIDNLESALRLLPRQESLERSREPVRRGRLDRARAARRLHRGEARARIPVQRVRRQEGPAEGRLGNHIQWQPVIHVADGRQTAKIRSR